MNDLFDYINKAKEKQGIKSDREFCRQLGLTHSTITAYQNGSFPNDETMIKIAEMAGVNHYQALVDLNIWRSPLTTKHFYAKIGEALKQSALTTACLALMASPSFAGTKQEQMNINHNANIYYQIFL